MSSAGVRVVGYSNVIEYRMRRSCTLLSNLSVVACQRDRHPSLSPRSASIFRDPYPWIAISLETATLTGDPVGTHFYHLYRPSAYHHDNLNPRHRISYGHRVCQVCDLRPYRRHANFVWVAPGPRPSGSPWLYYLHLSSFPPGSVDSLEHSFSCGHLRCKRLPHLSSYVGHHK